MATNNDTAIVNMTWISTTTGRNTIYADGDTRYHAISAIRTLLPTARSTSATSMVENGKSSRGKNTFVTRAALLVREPTDARNVDAEKFQASRPQKANSG